MLSLSRIVVVIVVLLSSTTLLNAQGGPLNGAGGDGDTTVPVKKIDLSVTRNNGRVNISWSTIGESQLSSFTIEKSLNASTFVPVSTVSAKNTSSAFYAYSDEATATTYYRIKATDKVGSVSYSSIVVLSAKAGKVLSVYPNPAVNSITLTHTPASVGASVSVLNILGKTVANKSILFGATQTSFNVSSFSKGTYIVSIFNNGQTETTQFVK